MKKLFIFITILAELLSPYPGDSTNSVTDPYIIFHNYYKAVGGIKKIKSLKTAYSEGKIEYDGLKGRFRLWEETPLRYRLEEDFSVISQIQGDDGQQAWRQDPNGKIMIQRDEETIKRRRITLRYENFEHLDPGSTFFTVSFEGIKKVSNRNCYVVKITNRLNQDILWNFFDQAGFLLIKSIDKHPDIEIHTVYSDYRNINGIFHPFYEESEILPRQKKEILCIEKCIMGPEMDPFIFQIPKNNIQDFQFQTGNRSENIPIEIIENNIFLTVKTFSDIHLWLLDSGASMSVIDQDYAQKMKIKSNGTIKGYGFGSNFDLNFITLPGFRVQGVWFGEQKIFSFKGLAEKFHEPKCIGILGYDFLSRFVVKIDYAEKQLSLYDPASFIYEGTGMVIDAPLKNGTFTIPMTVDETYTGKWSIDLGAFNTSFHFPYASSLNLFKKKGVYRISRGMGGEYMEKTIQFQTAKLGGYVIKTPRISSPTEKGSGATASTEMIGNIGNSILRHFILYLDYEKQQIIIEPGKNFNTNFPKDNSGMLIGRSEKGNPSIVFISQGSPGEKAGFKKGDIILSIDQKKFTHVSDILPIKKLLRQKKGTSLHFTVKRKGATKRLFLILQDMYP